MLAGPRERGDQVKVTVDSARCQGHTLCAMNAPQFFVLSDIDGHASFVGGDVPAESLDRIFEAAQSCPEQAIQIDGA